MPAYLLGAFAFLVGIMVFIMQNNTLVAVHFLGWQSAKISLAMVALMAAVVGAFITFLIDSFRAIKTGRKLRELMDQNRRLEKELRKGQKAAIQEKPSQASAAIPAEKEEVLP